MSEFEIRELPIPESEGAPGWDELLARTELLNAVVRDEIGSRDLDETPREALSWLTDPYSVARLFGAFDGDRLIGFGEFSKERAHSIGWAWVAVAADRRRAGIGTRLAHQLYAVADDAGATILETGVDHADFDSCPRLQSPAGAGSVPADAPATRFLQSQGFELGQVEVTSALSLPVADQLLTELTARSRNADDYELLAWTGPVPDDLIDGYARLRTIVTTAMPDGDLAVEEQVWDADRVRTADRQNAEAGSVTITTAARHRPTGELVAFTRLGYPAAADGRPAGQGFTLVLPEHRGHNLGIRIKINNLRLLNAADHGAHRITTGNAGENDAMLAINQALGFRPFVLRGAWQKKLRSPAETPA